MNVRGLRPKPGVVAFMQKVGIVAGALLAVGTVLSFVWKKVEAPVYAYASSIDERHVIVEEKLVALIEAHARQDSMLTMLIRGKR